MDDIVKALGHLTLGTRLKRLGERLQAQSQEVLALAGFDVPSGLMPVLAALDRLGAMRIGDLARALGVSQPAITRQVAKLDADGWVRVRARKPDRRVRSVSLTRAGRDLVARAKRDAWPSIEVAVADACTGPAGSLLARLDALEAALAAIPLKQRAERAGAQHASA